MTPPDIRNTLRGSPVVAAPGKVFLLGEYAVLEGAPAVVSSVGRLVPGHEAEHAERLRAEGVRVEAGHVLGPIPWWDGPRRRPT